VSFKHEQNGYDHKITITRQCSSCSGTGVYVGFAERDGFGIQCISCKGSGEAYQTIAFTEFHGKVLRNDIKTVLQTNPGISVGSKFDFGGVDYDEWFKTGIFPPKSEMRKFSCPAWFYQSADSDRKPDWEECIGVGMFSGCEHYPKKNKCWERFDKENLCDLTKIR
jgi:hypothetical protein